MSTPQDGPEGSTNNSKKEDEPPSELQKLREYFREVVVDGIEYLGFSKTPDGIIDRWVLIIASNILTNLKPEKTVDSLIEDIERIKKSFLKDIKFDKLASFAKIFSGTTSAEERAGMGPSFGDMLASFVKKVVQPYDAKVDNPVPESELSNKKFPLREGDRQFFDQNIVTDHHPQDFREFMNSLVYNGIISDEVDLGPGKTPGKVNKLMFAEQIGLKLENLGTPITLRFVFAQGEVRDCLGWNEDFPRAVFLYRTEPYPEMTDEEAFDESAQQVAVVAAVA